ncbi:MAG TPA: YqgE/AlgH family protein, partial [Kiloniellaceae bacterium]|nr:YqgE/AlgH family protein [Kiloniellaceae bacterium]
PGTVFVLHSGEFEMAGSRRVSPELALSANPEILKAIGAGEGPKGYIFAFGYAGWGPGQLESEIARGSWVDIPAAADLIFDAQNRIKWDKAIAAYSIEL